MKKFSNYPIYESKVIADLASKLPESNGIRERVDRVSKALGPKAANALYLTMVFAYSVDTNNIHSEAENDILSVLPKSKDSFINSVTSQMETLDQTSFEGYNDDTNETLWLIYKTYLAKTIAKEENQADKLDILNMYLRTFKNAREKSWKKIEDAVNKMHSDVSKEELENTQVKSDEITNLEQDNAVEDALKEEDKLLANLIKRAGLNKNTLKDYVNLVIDRTFKTVDNSSDEPVIKWKNKIAKGEPVDNDFVLGISAMICGAFITKDKTTIKEILGYLDGKTQDDLKAAKNKLMK